MRRVFPAANDFEGLKPVLQEVKTRLFEREFEAAFGRQEFREAYAVRWSSGRALGYANLVAGLCEGEAREEEWVKRLIEGGGKNKARVVCFGGGAAEVVAFGALLRFLRSDARGIPEGIKIEGVEGLSLEDQDEDKSLMELVLVDAADWTSVVEKLQEGLATPPELSKYASASARANNASLVLPGAIKTTFTQRNVLETSAEELRTMIGQEAALVTLLFTLNELYSASIPKTTKFLLELTEAMPKGSLLLVADSPGSYSEAYVGGKQKADEDKRKYPMHFLMDYVLLNKGKKGGEQDDDEDEDDRSEAAKKEVKWEKMMTDESRWFRLDEGLKFPVSLESMRFQMHLFRRV